MIGRLDFLYAADDSVTDSDVLRLAVQHAMAELGALGGCVHVRGSGGELHLVSSAGLPAVSVRAWEVLPGDSASATARAVGCDGRAWDPPGSRPADAVLPPAGAAGRVAVPLHGAEGRVGALTLLTGRRREPSAEEWRFLRQVADWVHDRLTAWPLPDPPARIPATNPADPTAPAPTDARELARALWNAEDALLRVDTAWRVTAANPAARALLGHPDGPTAVGRVLWQEPGPWQPPDAEERCRLAVARGRAAGFDAVLPATGRCHHVRVLPAPGGAVLHVMEAGAWRRRQADEVAAIRGSAERARSTVELTTALAAARTSQDVVTAVAERVLPPFAAHGLLVLVREGDRLAYIGSVGYPRSFLDDMGGTRGMTMTGRLPAERALLRDEPLFYASREEWLADNPGDDRPPSTKQAWAFLPLTASGRTFGVCVMAFDTERRLTPEERTLLLTISALVAQALERARLSDAELTRSRELQRDLLPRHLPRLREATATARYVPAGQGSDVGGDWYDLIPLSAGRVALVCGDVMGHGLSEAATMGRLRTATHTLAALELPPDELMGHLNDIVAEIGPDAYATCLYTLYDATTGTCTVVRAGHPPPLVVHPDGRTAYPDVPDNPPLGGARPPFETADLTLPADSLLLLYTDGLVESAQRDIDEGMAALARLAAAADRTDLDRLADHLVARLLPGGQPATDDAALLVACLHALPRADVASWQLPDGPRAAGEARRHVREQLATWHLDDLSVTTELLASELVGNVVRHAKGPIGFRLLRTGALVCEVSDASLTMPRVRRASETDEGGRGLQLVSVLAERWGSRFTPDGKTIWTEQPLTPSPETVAEALLSLADAD
ncbi:MULTISPECIES: ATP-binding SpoIIE family protein phosphatase [unclassified Streptomyces]|uniref:ATP-binding SpoIIE family protein phosphatase n=1 Tax=unclassified Streptomyces TaxID=2593676 RepID=UPI00068B8123|nr:MULTISPECIES: ATP-binding SpoIIE family protein phosphatase [unclassified Streptomyces]